jgi:hypothetical protein
VQTLTFDPGGALSQNLAITINGDTITEADETFTVVLSNAVNGLIDDGIGTGTIVSDDSVPAISVDDVVLAEGDSGTAAAVFTVSLSNPSKELITVEVTTEDGTATTGGGDYVAISTPEVVTFSPGGPLSQPVAVTVNGDLTTETDEIFTVDLANASNASILDASGMGTIQNDDAAPSVSIGDATVVEGDAGTAAAEFSVTLSNPSAFPITMLVATAEGTATLEDADFIPIDPPGLLEFSPDSSLTQTVTVLVNGDTDPESDEHFFVDLSDAVNASLADARGQGNITNDDGTVAVEPIPAVTFIGTAYPNPFSARATIPIGLHEAGSVRVRVYDAGGRLVRTLLDDVRGAGVWSLEWDGLNQSGAALPSGFFVVRAEVGRMTLTKSVRIVR